MKFYKNLIIVILLFVVFPSLVYSSATQRNIGDVHCVIAGNAASIPATPPFNTYWKVLDLSSLTNSHSAFPGVTPSYQYQVYCNFGGGDNNCLPTGFINNTLVYLSAKTNSHVQAPDLLSTNPAYSSNYPYSLCYSDLVSCSSIPSTASCDSGDRKSTRLNSSHTDISRMPSSA